MNRESINIKGMHCRSCEILIEDELSKIRGVKKVIVSEKKGTALICYNGKLDLNEVEEAVKSAGYSLGEDKKSIFSKNIEDYKEFLIAGISLFIIYSFANELGLFKIAFSGIGNNSNLFVVLLIGLTAGLSTCMALVGGLLLGAASRFASKHPTASTIQKFKPHLFFNLGRITSFFVLGGVIGFAGSFFQLSTTTLGFMTVIVGIVMFILGAQLIQIIPIFNKINFTFPKSLSRLLGFKSHDNKEYSNRNSIFLGALTFFLPCGFTQAMQIYAISTGSPIKGALTMGIFAIGTAPGLLGIGGITSVVKGAFARIFFKFAGIVVILLAFFNISNGFNLSGLSIPVFSNNSTASAISNDPNVEIKDGVQIVKMTQSGNGYEPNTFTIKKNIPVKWVINSTDVYTCASSIISSKLGVRQSLQLGENIIEFTPKEVGVIRFSCSMGMYNGVFNVVDSSENGVSKSTDTIQANNAVSGSSCGGSGCGCGGAAKKIQPAVAKAPSTIEATPAIVTNQGSESQILKATYTLNDDIQPNTFTVRSGQPVRFEIYAKEDGVGCMGSVMIPRLVNSPELFTKGQTTVFNFTPQSKGQYLITCAMGVPRGYINVN